MVKDYATQYYEPAASRHTALCANDFAVARQLAVWETRVRAAWEHVTLEATLPDTSRILVGESFPVSVRLTLPGLQPSDVLVEAVTVRREGREDETVVTAPLSLVEDGGNTTYRYAGELTAHDAGVLSLGIRVLPHHPMLQHKHALRLVRWATAPHLDSA